MDELRPPEVVLVRRVEPARGVESAFRFIFDDPEHDKVVGEGFYGAMSSLKRNCACGKRGDDAPLKKSTIDDDGVTVETGLRSPSPGPSASTKVKVTPGIDETDL